MTPREAFEVAVSVVGLYVAAALVLGRLLTLWGRRAGGQR